MLRTTFFALVNLAILDSQNVAAINLATDMEASFDHDLLALSETDAQPDDKSPTPKGGNAVKKQKGKKVEPKLAR